jgi:xylulokinase
VTEGAAYGAALLAGVGAGVWADVAEAARRAVAVTGRLSPGPDAAVYADFYPRYRALYPALRTEFAAVAAAVSRHL